MFLERKLEHIQERELTAQETLSQVLTVVSVPRLLQILHALFVDSNHLVFFTRELKCNLQNYTLLNVMSYFSFDRPRKQLLKGTTTYSL